MFAWDKPLAAAAALTAAILGVAAAVRENTKAQREIAGKIDDLRERLEHITTYDFLEPFACKLNRNP